ncbi:MAG: MbcA/ParS/Xre antitoxin family protein [Rhizobium sp.]|nr:MbcA/ParS/Xre antitoxin family protein [Rhizobium sp.]
MSNSGNKLRIPQPVKQVVVDAALLPKAPAQPVAAKGKRKAKAATPVVASPAAAVDGKAKVNVVAPVAPQVAAMRQKLKQQSVQSQIARVDAAIEAGTVSPADAKTLVLALATKRLGSKETAEKWYRSQHLEAFGGRTPAQMVRAGELKALVALMRAEAAQNKA